MCVGIAGRRGPAFDSCKSAWVHCPVGWGGVRDAATGRIAGKNSRRKADRLLTSLCRELNPDPLLGLTDRAQRLWMCRLDGGEEILSSLPRNLEWEKRWTESVTFDGRRNSILIAPRNVDPEKAGLGFVPRGTAGVEPTLPKEPWPYCRKGSAPRGRKKESRRNMTGDGPKPSCSTTELPPEENRAGRTRTGDQAFTKRSNSNLTASKGMWRGARRKMK